MKYQRTQPFLPSGGFFVLPFSSSSTGSHSQAASSSDGLISNVRGLTFGAEAQFHRYLGYYVAGFSVDADFGLDSEIVMHNRPGRLAALYAVRNQPRPNVLLVFAVKEHIDRRLSAQEQFELVERAFAGDGW